jgi:hypothetical protein
LFHELSEEEKVGDEYFAGVHSPDAILILGIAQVNISTEIKLKAYFNMYKLKSYFNMLYKIRGKTI